MQLDLASQDDIIGRIVDASRGDAGRRGFGILWNLENEQLARHFDRLIKMDNGRVVEDLVSQDDKQLSEPEPRRVSD